MNKNRSIDISQHCRKLNWAVVLIFLRGRKMEGEEMNRSGEVRLPRHLIVAVLAIGLASSVFACGPPTNAGKRAAEERQATMRPPDGNEVLRPEDSHMTREAAYQKLYKSVDALGAVLRQQSSNIRALEHASTAVEKNLAVLLAAVGSNERPGDKQEAIAETGVATVGPTGPVSPSSRPSSAAERERRRRATEEGTYLPTRPRGSIEATVRLSNELSEKEIQRDCSSASALNKEFQHILKTTPTDVRKLQALADELCKTIHQLSKFSNPSSTKALDSPDRVKGE